MWTSVPQIVVSVIFTIASLGPQSGIGRSSSTIRSRPSKIAARIAPPAPSPSVLSFEAVVFIAAPLRLRAVAAHSMLGPAMRKPFWRTDSSEMEVEG